MDQNGPFWSILVHFGLKRSANRTLAIPDKYILNSRRFFDDVFVLNSNSLTKNIIHVCVFVSVSR